MYAHVSYLYAPSSVCKEENRGAISFEGKNKENGDVNFTDGRAINIGSVSLVYRKTIRLFFDF